MKKVIASLIVFVSMVGCSSLQNSTIVQPQSTNNISILLDDLTNEASFIDMPNMPFITNMLSITNTVSMTNTVSNKEYGSIDSPNYIILGVIICLCGLALTSLVLIKSKRKIKIKSKRK